MKSNSLERCTVGELAAMANEIAARAKEVAADKAALDSELARRYPTAPDFTGTDRRDDDGYCVKIEVPKRVDWDTGKLNEACYQLECNDQDPREFVEFSAKVSETVYKSIPERFRKMLEPARTVKPGKPKITLERIDT